jgi:hypothetical protein
MVITLIAVKGLLKRFRLQTGLEIHNCLNGGDWLYAGDVAKRALGLKYLLVREHMYSVECACIDQCCYAVSEQGGLIHHHHIHSYDSAYS